MPEFLLELFGHFGMGWLALGFLLGLLWVANSSAIRYGGRGYDRRIAWLREGRTFDRYRDQLARLLATISDFIGDNHRPKSTPWSATSFLFCFGLAIVFPGFLLIANWLFFGVTYEADLLPAERGIEQVSTVVATLVFPSVAVATIRFFAPFPTRKYLFATIVVATAIPNAFIAFGSILITVIGGILSTFVAAGVGLNRSHVILGGAGAAAVAASFSTVLAYSGLQGFAFLWGGLAAVTLALLARAAHRFRIGFLGGVLLASLTLVFALALPLARSHFGALTFGQITTVNDANPIVAHLILVLILIPAASAPVSWASLAITRQLLRKIARGREGPIGATLIAIVDLFLAVILFAGVSISTVLFVSLYEHVNVCHGGEPVYFLSKTLREIGATAYNAKWVWVYAVLLIPITPTILHFALAVGTLWLSFVPFREWLANAVERAHKDVDSDLQLVALTVLWIVQVVPIVTAIALCCGTFYLVSETYPQICSMLMQFLMRIADTIGAGQSTCT